MDDLRAAIEAESWSLALGLALERWREARAAALADLVDQIAAKLDAPKPPKGSALHAWWMSNGSYDPDLVSALVACASMRAGDSDGVTWEKIRGRHGGSKLASAPLIAELHETAGPAFAFRGERLNVIDRFAAMTCWLDDPRTAGVLATWMIETPYRWEPIEHGRATVVFYRAIANRLAALADERVLDRLRACVAAPRAPTQTLRAVQARSLPATIAAIEARVRALAPTDARAIAECAAAISGRLASTSPPRDDADGTRLWRAVAADPTDTAARTVLGDALVERGDIRGEIIALQCSGTAKAAARAKTLINKHWSALFGDLALVLNRKGTELRNGMLEVARIGTPKTPEWAFARAIGHRELATVHTVLPGHVKPEHYATFISDPAMPLARLGIDAPEIIDAMVRVRKRWPLRCVWYTHASIAAAYRYDFPPLRDTFAKLASLAPDLEEVRFGTLSWPEGVGEQLVALVRELPERLPALRRIVIEPYAIAPLFRERLAAIPLVIVEE